jgi:hypothetical protein
MTREYSANDGGYFGGVAALSPFRQIADKMAENLHFLGGFDPSRQLFWRAEGGGGVKSCLRSALFWLYANSLVWRKGPLHHRELV